MIFVWIGFIWLLSMIGITIYKMIITKRIKEKKRLLKPIKKRVVL